MNKLHGAVVDEQDCWVIKAKGVSYKTEGKRMGLWPVLVMGGEAWTRE